MPATAGYDHRNCHQVKPQRLRGDHPRARKHRDLHPIDDHEVPRGRPHELLLMKAHAQQVDSHDGSRRVPDRCREPRQHSGQRREPPFPRHLFPFPFLSCQLQQNHGQHEASQHRPQLRALDPRKDKPPGHYPEQHRRQQTHEVVPLRVPPVVPNGEDIRHYQHRQHRTYR